MRVTGFVRLKYQYIAYLRTALFPHPFHKEGHLFSYLNASTLELLSDSEPRPLYPVATGGKCGGRERAELLMCVER